MLSRFTDNCDIFLQKHAICFQQFSDFLNNEKKIFFIKGFMGSGKSFLINHLKKNISEDIIHLSFELQQTTTLDDIILSFNNQFKTIFIKYSIQNIKFNTNDFRERINICFHHIQKKVIVFIDSLDTLNNNATKTQILDFLFNIASINEVKLVFTSRSSEPQLLQKTECEKYILETFTPNDTKKILNEQKQTTLGKVFEDFCEITQGHFLYISLFLEITKIYSINYDVLISEFERKKEPIDEFLINKLLTLVPQTYSEILLYLITCNNVVSEKMLTEFGLLKKDELSYLTKIKLLYKTKDFYYIKDYIKQELDKTFDEYTKLKAHRALKNYYLSLLPLKPSERDLELSRETIRQLIEYHNSFEQKLYKENKPTRQINPLYQQYEYLHSLQIDKKTTLQDNLKNATTTALSSTDNNAKIDGIALTEEELDLLNKQDLQEATENEKNSDSNILTNFEAEYSYDTNPPQMPQEKTIDTVEEILCEASKLEDKFNYSEALLYYEKALLVGNKDKEIFINTKISNCHNKLGNTEKAISILEHVLNLCNQAQDGIKSAYIILKLAELYRDNYKLEIAKQYFQKILELKIQIPDSIKIRARLELAGIEENSDNIFVAKNLYKNILKDAQNTNDTLLLAEAYFKYALCLDDTGETKDALANYKACTLILPSSDENNYLSPAYTNIAAILAENLEFAEALKAYEKALAIDIKNENNEGLYFVYTKIAELYEKISPEKVVTMYMKSLFIAQQLKDNFYICSSHLYLGDTFYKKNQFEMALKHYLHARKFAKIENSFKNIDSIDARLKDLEIKLGKEKFKTYLEELKKNARKK